MIKEKIILPRYFRRRDGVYVFDYEHLAYADNWCYPARTLDPDYLGRHSDGWHIVGNVEEDYFRWINNFKATNGKHFVCGNFEKLIYADSPETLVRFLSKYPYTEWDYGDI